jgi:ABC-2 type transport system ATP-binding protein
VDEEGHHLTVAVGGGADSLREALLLLKERDIEVRDVGLRRPTLDDVFLTLTGHVAEEAPEEPTETPEREKERV